MALVEDTAKPVEAVLTAATDALLEAEMDADAETNLVVLTDTALCAAMAAWTCDTTVAPMAMPLVAAMLTAGSNDPLE